MRGPLKYVMIQGSRIRHGRSPELLLRSRSLCNIAEIAESMRTGFVILWTLPLQHQRRREHQSSGVLGQPGVISN